MGKAKESKFADAASLVATELLGERRYFTAKMKRVKVFNERTQKMGRKTLKYKDGGVVTYQSFDNPLSQPLIDAISKLDHFKGWGFPGNETAAPVPLSQFEREEMSAWALQDDAATSSDSDGEGENAPTPPPPVAQQAAVPDAQEPAVAAPHAEHAAAPAPTPTPAAAAPKKAAAASPASTKPKVCACGGSICCAECRGEGNSGRIRSRLRSVSD